MKQQEHDQQSLIGPNRRAVLKGAASAAAFGTAGALGAFSDLALAQDNLRAKILQIPGVGKGPPTDADWQKVGELCLGPTKANVKEGEFEGVELSFMGLNNQNLHNVLFRGFLKPWEAYTGAKITWIDLAQADYNPRLQQAIATGTVDFDIVEMGAPFEGDVCGKGLTSEMPDWVKKQIDIDDYRRTTCKPPVGTWNGKHTASPSTATATTSTTAPTCSPMPTSPRRGRTAAARRMGRAEDLAAGAGGHQVPQGQEVQGPGRLRLSRRAQALGRVRLLLPRQPRHRLCQASRRQGLAVRRRHDEAARQQPGLGARDPGRDRRAALRAADQINADPNTTGFQQFLGGTGSMIAWWGDIGSNAKTNDSSVIGDVVGFSILPGSDDVYNSKTGKWDKLASGPNYAPNCAYLGWGVYVMARVDSDAKKQKAAWSAAAHLGGKDLSLWTAMYPSGFQPYRNSHFNIPEWVAAGYDEAFITSYLKSEADSLQPPERGDRAAHPRHLPVLQRRRGRAGQDLRRQDRCADRRRRHRRRLGEADRPDRPRQADRALQGLARRVALAFVRAGAVSGTGQNLQP